MRKCFIAFIIVSLFACNTAEKTLLRRQRQSPQQRLILTVPAIQFPILLPLKWAIPNMQRQYWLSGKTGTMALFFCSA